MRLFLAYVFVELAAIAVLASTVGVGWTVLAVVAVFALGVVLAGSQLRRQLRTLRSGLAVPRMAATDGLLIALGTVLTVVPGLVSSVLGLLLLLPPTRALARPAATALVSRRLGGALLVTRSTRGAGRRRGQWDVIDGEVIDVTDVAQEQVTPPSSTRPPV